MKCDNCKKEEAWLEIIGKDLVCRKCTQVHREMGLIYRTHIETFRFLLRKLQPSDYKEYMKITRKQIEELADLKKAGVKFRTTNVIELG